MKTLENIRVVLVEPSHPGNIGATARAMANMGLTRLCLVAPVDFPSAVATARASGADSLLREALVVDTLDDALADCSLIVGTTARARSVGWTVKTPEEAMKRLLSEKHAATALLFGRESSGLTNEELDRCHLLTRIPVAESFSSLNLGAAVTVLLYELRRQALEELPAEDALEAPPSTATDMRHFYEHLERILEEAGLRDSSAANRLRLLTRMFNRAEMLRPEVQLMRGLFSAIEEKLHAASRR